MGFRIPLLFGLLEHLNRTRPLLVLSVSLGPVGIISRWIRVQSDGLFGERNTVAGRRLNNRWRDSVQITGAELLDNALELCFTFAFASRRPLEPCVGFSVCEIESVVIWTQRMTTLFFNDKSKVVRHSISVVLIQK